jgi:multidrug efflux pump
MQRFNLSQWSITHRPLVLFVIILLGAAGIYSYLNLGRAEDPSFTIKTMIVHVGWPGATAAELQAQAVDKVEKKLQELPYLDRIESYSQPGGAFIRVTLSDKTPPAKVKDLWYQVRKKVGDTKNELPPGITGPDFNDEYGDVYSALYMLTAEGLSLADLKARAEDIRQRLLRFPMSTRSTSSASGRRKSSSSSVTPSSPCSGSRPSRSSTAWPGRTPSSPAARSTPRPTASICG